LGGGGDELYSKKKLEGCIDKLQRFFERSQNNSINLINKTKTNKKKNNIFNSFSILKMYPQTSNNPNSNNPYAYQQMPPNFLNEGD